MSEPTYRIDLEHHPHDEDWPWAASVINVPVSELAGDALRALLKGAKP